MLVKHKKFQRKCFSHNLMISKLFRFLKFCLIFYYIFFSSWVKWLIQWFSRTSSEKPQVVPHYFMGVNAFYKIKTKCFQFRIVICHATSSTKSCGEGKIKIFVHFELFLLYDWVVRDLYILWIKHVRYIF